MTSQTGYLNFLDSKRNCPHTQAQKHTNLCITNGAKDNSHCFLNTKDKPFKKNCVTCELQVLVQFRNIIFSLEHVQVYSMLPGPINVGKE